MLGYEKREVRILGLEFGIVEAVSVNGDNTVCILGNDISVRIHAECSYLILELLRTVNDLTLIEFGSQIGEYDCRELYSDTDINSVGECLDIKLAAYLLDPLTAGASDRNDAPAASIGFAQALYLICTVFKHLKIAYGRIEEEINFILEHIEDVAQYLIVLVCSEMSYGSIKKMEFILKTDLLE